MTKEDLMQLATKGDVQEFCQAMLKKMEELLKPSEIDPNDKYLKLADVEAYTSHGQSTIRKWLKTGKKDAKGNIVKLPYKEFSHGDYRVKKSDLEWFGSIGSGEELPQKKNLKRPLKRSELMRAVS